MAYTIRNASSTRTPRTDTANEAIWRMLNILVGALDTHVHGGVTAGGGNSAGFSLPAGARYVGNEDGRDPTGAVITPLGSAQVLNSQDEGREGTVTVELTLAINAILKAIHNHTHAVTAGGASCAAWPLPGGVTRISDNSGLDPDGNAVTSPTKVSRIGRAGSARAALVTAWNALVTAVENHIHGGCTAGAGNTGAMVINSGGALNKVADLYGKGSDGVTVA